jgi:hypothetical protein
MQKASILLTTAAIQVSRDGRPAGQLRGRDQVVIGAIVAAYGQWGGAWTRRGAERGGPASRKTFCTSIGV